MVEQWEDNKINDSVNQILIDKLKMIGELVEGEAKLKIVDLGAVDTGRLLGSITHEVDENNLSVVIGTDTEYAPYVELGTNKMPARPFLRPAVYENIDKIKEILKDA